jgi:hypothetical protein
MRPHLTAQQRQLALRLKARGLSVHSAEDLARIAVSLNGRPRKTLGFMTPSESSPSSLRTPVEPAMSSIYWDRTMTLV